MRDVIIYTAGYCPYCTQAKRLLDHKRVPYREIDVSDDAALRQQMMQASGRRTVPQIFIGEESIGGFEELRALDQSGELDGKLGVGA